MLQAHKHAVPLKVAAVALLVARACEDPALWTCTCCDIAGELLPVVDFVARSRGAWASLKVWAQRLDATPRSARDAERHTEVPEWLQIVPELHGWKGAMDVDVEAAGVGVTMVETAALALKVGDQVEGLYSNGDWYRARIVSIVDLGKKKKQKRNMDRLGKRMGYELAWDDGDTSETIKPASDVRRIEADVGADAGIGACEGGEAEQDVRMTEKQRARQIQTDWCGDEGWGLQETLKDRALEWYLSALTALDPRAQRAAHVTTCAHVARLFLAQPQGEHRHREGHNAATDGLTGTYDDCSLTVRAVRSGPGEFIIGSQDLADCGSFGRADISFRIVAAQADVDGGLTMVVRELQYRDSGAAGDLAPTRPRGGRS